MYALWMPWLSIALPGQNWDIRLAIVGAGLRVFGFFRMHVPGFRRVVGLIRIISKSSSLFGLRLLITREYRLPYGK